MDRCGVREYLSSRNIIRFLADGSLSDTAVGLQGLQGLDGGLHRKQDHRSPRSETTPTRERERFGVGGMGKKSNSTSQLSATGKLLLWMCY